MDGVDAAVKNGPMDGDSVRHNHGDGVPETKIADVVELDIDELLVGGSDNKINCSVDAGADGDGYVEFNAKEGVDAAKFESG